MLKIAALNQKKILSFFAFVPILSLFPTIQLYSKPLQCDVPAPIAILINAKTGKVLYEKNAQAPYFPASTTKVATALYALHKKPSGLNTTWTGVYETVGAVSPQARRMSGKHPSYRLEFGGTHMGIKPGEILDYKTLLYGLMLVSANDSANMIAEMVSGSVPDFMKEMNAFLKEIGCTNTNFRNPHGLPDPHHYTTAHDMAKISRLAMQNSFFRDVVKTVRYTRPTTNKQEESNWLQFNALLKKGKYYYPHAIGVKTGYTDHAGYNLVAAAEKGDRSLIAIACYCDEVGKRYRSVINLFEAAFNEIKVSRKLFSKEHDLFHKTVLGAKQALDAELSQDVIIQYYPSEKSEYVSKVKWKEMSLPIYPGNEVGNVLIYDQEGVLQISMPLHAVREVSPSFGYQCARFFEEGSLRLKEYRLYVGLLLGIMTLSFSFWHYKKRKRLPS